MVATVPFSPYVTTSAAGSFNVSSGGVWQGMPYDDPAIRYSLVAGVLASTETLPMWGGVGISEALSGLSTLPGAELGNIITRATTETATSSGGLTGFSVFQMNYAAINSPQSPVPLIGSGGQVNFYRLGSGARIPVAMDPSLVSLEGGIISAQVSWDFNNQVLQPYDASTATYSLTSITSSYSSTTGLYTMVVVAAEATPVAGVGDSINVSGVTGTGAALVNGDQTITAFTDNEHFTFQVAAASGAIATGALSGTLLLNYGTGALNVKVIGIEIGNSGIVQYNSVTGAATWNRAGSCAIILI
jgi:hypothetical protein